MKKIILVAALAAVSMGIAETIKLPPPDKDSGVSVVQALKARHSERAFSERISRLRRCPGCSGRRTGSTVPTSARTRRR